MSKLIVQGETINGENGVASTIAVNDTNNIAGGGVKSAQEMFDAVVTGEKWEHIVRAYRIGRIVIVTLYSWASAGALGAIILPERYRPPIEVGVPVAKSSNFDLVSYLLIKPSGALAIDGDTTSSYFFTAIYVV